MPAALHRPPVNPHRVDRRAYKSRADAARRSEPLINGRRDPDRRPAGKASDPRLDPIVRDMREVWRAVCPAHRVVLERVIKMLEEATWT